MIQSDPTPSAIECQRIVEEWLVKLQEAAARGNPESFGSVFLTNGWLRDMLCFSWDFRTLEGRTKIVQYLSESGRKDGRNKLSSSAIGDIRIDTECTLAAAETFEVPGAGTYGIISPLKFTLDNPARLGRGVVRLLRSSDPDDSQQWKAFTLLLSAEDIIGHEEPKEPPRGIYDDHSVPWGEVKAKMVEEIETDPTVLIIGGSQGGLMNAARFGRMGIKTLVIDKHPRVGDAWRKRYREHFSKPPSSSFLSQDTQI